MHEWIALGNGVPEGIVEIMHDGSEQAHKSPEEDQAWGLPPMICSGLVLHALHRRAPLTMAVVPPATIEPSASDGALASGSFGALPSRENDRCLVAVLDAARGDRESH